MSYRINSIEVYNFKFFEKPFILPVNGKHILLFGENGSGKSSLFWSFYTHYQAVYKPQAEAQKYFLTNSESLRNKFSSPDEHSGIKVSFIDENNSIQIIEDSDSNLSVNSAPAKSMMLATMSSSDFLNYKVLSSIFNFKNSEDNEIFNVFEKEIFQYLSLRNSLVISGNNIGNDAQAWWQYLKNEYKNLPRNRKNYNDFNQNAPEYKAFGNLIATFNDDLRYALTQLIISANQILRDDFSIPVQLTVRYEPVTFNERVPGTSRSRDRQVTPPKIILNAKMMHGDIVNQDVQKPSSFFNEAKLTCMALALRLAVLNGKPTEGVSYASSLFIDDLLISLDMSYRRNVVEILLRNTDKRQVLFFTHDRSLYNLIKEELDLSKKSKEWLFYELYSKEENNRPVPELITPTTPLEEARAFLHEHRIPACANALRRACEKQMRRLLPYSKQLKTDPHELSSTPLLDFNGLISKFEHIRRDLGMPDIAHGLSTDRKLILNPFSHDDVDTPFYRAELERLIKCCEKLESIDRNDIVTPPMVHNDACRIVVSNAGHTAEATFTFSEVMVKYRYEGQDYYTKPRVHILTCTSDASLVGKEKGISILYHSLFNSVSLTVSTCPELKDVIFKTDGALLIT